MKYVIDNTLIRDEYGRERIFKGINICLKDPELKPSIVKKWLDFAIQKSDENGINIIRLGTTWASIEPKQGEYNDALIKQFRAFVDECAKKDISVLLDMHQDLFTKQGKYGDGAPKWAIDPSIEEKRPLAIWAEGYFYMDSVQQEFFDFWTNKNGIQDKFVDMWVNFASFFKDCDNIIGYDFLNEPYPYKNGRKIFLTMLEELVKHSLGESLDLEQNFKTTTNRKAFIKSVLQIARVVKTPKRLKKMLSDFEKYDTFKYIQRDFSSFIDDFNEKYYQAFIDKMSDRLNDRLGFFEHNYYSNMGVPFGINAGGKIYSPHAYDVFIDTQMYNHSSPDRIQVILDQIKANQDKMAVPVIFGEWGGGCKRGTGWIDHIDYVYNNMEKNKWSNIYWSYQFKNKAFCKVMNRPYPIAICGTIDEYHSDNKTRTFTLKWTQDKEYPVPNEIYTPNGIVKIDGIIGKNEYQCKY